VAAVCFAIALISSIVNISLMGQIKLQQRELAHLSDRSAALARNLATERIAMFDMLDSHAHRYDIGEGEVITRGSRMYLALHALAQPPRGKVYEAWVAEGNARALASPTFLPDARGVAFIVLPGDARTATAVLVTIEPDGGSREPTAKPLMQVSLREQ
jgi:hypothetical protein